MSRKTKWAFAGLAAGFALGALAACEPGNSAVCDDNPCFSRECPGFPGDQVCGLATAPPKQGREAGRSCAAGCPDDAPMCDRALDRCVACYRHSDCTEDETFCDVSAGRCRTRCERHDACGDATLWCAEGYCRPQSELEFWGDTSFEVGYLRPQIIAEGAKFGSSLALSADGRTLATHAQSGSGEVEVWVLGADGWQREARLLAERYSDPFLHLEYALALSADGNVLVVGDPHEVSLDKGVFTTFRSGGAATTSAGDMPGAAYVFERRSGVWSLSFVLKPSNAHAPQRFGAAVALSANGQVLAVGSPRERSAASGIDGVQTDLSVEDAGAVYLFERTTDVWRQSSYLKASDNKSGLYFGYTLALSRTGSVLAIGAPSQLDDDESVYLFESRSREWEERQVLRPDGPDNNVGFGEATALSADGRVLVVSSSYEDLDAFLPTPNISLKGVVRVYERAQASWNETAVLFPQTEHSSFDFGRGVALSDDGRVLAVGVPGDFGVGTGLNPPMNSDERFASGAAYVFQRFHRDWERRLYVKHRFEQTRTRFGLGVALSASGDTLAVSANEDFGSSVEGSILDRQGEPEYMSGSVTVFKRAPE